MFVEIISAVIGGGNFLKSTETVKKGKFYGPSHFIIAIDPKRFNKNIQISLNKYLKELSKNNTLRIPGNNGSRIEKKELNLVFQ